MLKAGDVVRLKSGGPKMTIEWITEEKIPAAMCSWFNGADMHQQKEFTTESLDIAKE